jgi:ribonuclease E
LPSDADAVVLTPEGSAPDANGNARPPREPRGEGRRERGERGGRRERRPADDTAAPPSGEGSGEAQTGAEPEVFSTLAERAPVDAGYSYFTAPTAASSDSPMAAEVPSTTEAAGDTERAPREKRSRDRYGRDRRDRNGGGRARDGAEGTDALAEPAPAAAPVSQEASTPTPAPSPAPAAPDVVVAQPSAVVPPEVPQAAAPAPVALAPAPATTDALPRVAAYALPMGDLQQIAQAAGLEWINSDATRVAQAQASIAATPVAPHVPREPKPSALPDDGPLMLVETRRDLKNMALPFDTQA